MSLRIPASPTGATRILRSVAAAAAVPIFAAACSSGDGAPPTTAADSVTITDQWAKAAEGGMSAAFGRFHNSAGREVTVTAASSPVSATVELHEVATDGGEVFMRPKAGGFVIPAHGDLDLAPGGEHIMFIDLRGALRTGTDAPVTLTFSDGSTTTFTAQVRDFSGNQEDYRPDGGARPPAHGD